ncbi:MAG TPA: ABC transporter permease [Gemmatimonadaceae bacterium]|nr:ABC transporter permease [Gemmatimonadaceae bacterium]
MTKKSFRLSDARPDASRDVDDEVTFHLEMRAREFMEQGMSEADARREAARSFGDVQTIQGDLRTERNARNTERRRRDWWDALRMDARYALRALRKNPAFSVAAISTLSLGLGATLAVFTVVNGVMLRPLPYRTPDRIALVWLNEASTDGGVAPDLPLSSGFFSDLARDATAFQALAAFRAWSFSLEGAAGSPPEPVSGSRVSPALFEVLGVRPLIGQAFTNADAQPGGPGVALISYSLWQRRFGGDPGIVGRRIVLSNSPATVLGVMPPGFAFPRGAELPAWAQFGLRTDVWTPLVLDSAALRNYSTQNLSVIGRLKDGVTRTNASADVNRLLSEFLRANAPGFKLEYHLVPMSEQAARTVRRGLLILLGSVSFLLLIACANVASLLVARATGRQRELAVRAALGAGRGRIARQLVTENVALALAAALIGIAISYWGTRVMLSLVPGSMPRADDIGLDWRVLLFAAGVAVLAGIVFGLAAAWSTRSRELSAALHTGGTRSTGGMGRRFGRQALVAVEVALSLMLLIGAALLTRSFIRLQHVPPGFDAHGVLAANASLPIAGQLKPLVDGPRWATTFNAAMERLSKAPGIESVGAISSLPLTGAVEGGGVLIPDQPPPAPGKIPHAQYQVVAGDYFRTMHVRTVQGRVFDTRDDATGMRTMVVNREFVRRFLREDSSVIGHVVSPTFTFERNVSYTIVGVVDDVKQMALDGDPEPQVYVPQSQMSYPFLSIVLRTTGDPLTAVPTLRRELMAVDPTFTLNDLRTMDDVLDQSLARQRFSMMLIGVFAVSALVLAVVGLYGVIALLVGQRKREIGVRVALGARPADVIRMVLAESSRVSVAGVVAGIVGAIALTRVIAAMLYGVSATDASTFVAAALVVVAVSLAAAFIPARRASRVDPTIALRAE